MIIFDNKRKDTVLQAVKISGLQPKRLIVTDGITDMNVVSYHDYVDVASNREPMVAEPLNIYEETTRLYTSGTTGRAKGVPLTSINEVLSAHDIMIHFPMSFRDVTLNTTPWFHRGGIHCGGPCPTFYAGGTLVVMNKFDTVNTLRYVSRYHITFVIGVPTVLEELADAQEKTTTTCHPSRASSPWARHLSGRHASATKRCSPPTYTTATARLKRFGTPSSARLTCQSTQEQPVPQWLTTT